MSERVKEKERVEKHRGL